MGSWRVKVASPRLNQVEKEAFDRTGRTLDKIRIMDLQANATMKSQVNTLKLNEFFDDNGAMHFRRLGLSFAAKHHRKEGPRLEEHEEQQDFGSSATVPAAEEDGVTAKAKAFFLSTLMKEKDTDRCNARLKDLYDSVPADERIREMDVSQRQVEIVFSEVPNCDKYFPLGVDQKHLLPPDRGWEASMREVRLAERAAHLLHEKNNYVESMGWMFTRSEVLILVEIAGLWSRAMRPSLPSCVMDRSTYCRLILDLGLVDQDRVPYYWAVALFDSRAKYMRACAVENMSTSSAQGVPTINIWLLVCIIDFLVRKLWDLPVTGKVKEDIKKEFLLSLFDVARYRLPESVIKDSELVPEEVSKSIIQGRELRIGNEDDDASSGGSEIEDVTGSDAPAGSPRSLGQKSRPSKDKPLIGIDFMSSPLLHGMLVEPEVLHLVAQYEPVFETLFSNYLDSETEKVTSTDRGTDGSNAYGHMGYPQFLQFCIDFNMTPQLASSHFLKHAYDMSQCLQACSQSEVYIKRKTQKLGMNSELRSKVMRILYYGVRTGALRAVIEDYFDGGATRKSGKGHKRSSVQGRSHGALSGFDIIAAGLSVGNLGNSLKRRGSWAKKSGKSSDTTSPRVGSANSSTSSKAPRNGKSSQESFHSSKPLMASQKSGGSQSARRPTNVNMNSKETDSTLRKGKDTGAGTAARRSSFKATRGKSLTSELEELSKAASLPAPEPEKPKEPPRKEAKPVEGPKPWGDVVFAAREKLERDARKALRAAPPQKEKTRAAKFGVSSFAESVCRVAFTYMATYGNSSQTSSGPYVRTIWMIAYLRCVFKSLHASLKKKMLRVKLTSNCSERQAVSQEIQDVCHEPLRRALQQITEQQWKSPPQEIACLLPPTPALPLLPESAVSDALSIQKRRRSLVPEEFTAGRQGSKASQGSNENLKRSNSKGSGYKGWSDARKASKKRGSKMGQAVEDATGITTSEDCSPSSARIKASGLCVVDGTCTVCGLPAGEGEWGNPRCHGCSIVDMLPFEDHLFKKLLMHVPDDNLKVKAAHPPLKTRKHCLTPPPMGRSHSLRKAPERKKVGILEPRESVGALSFKTH